MNFTYDGGGSNVSLDWEGGNKIFPSNFGGGQYLKNFPSYFGGGGNIEKIFARFSVFLAPSLSFPIYIFKFF